MRPLTKKWKQLPGAQALSRHSQPERSQLILFVTPKQLTGAQRPTEACAQYWLGLRASTGPATIAHAVAPALAVAEAPSYTRATHSSRDRSSQLHVELAELRDSHRLMLEHQTQLAAATPLHCASLRYRHSHLLLLRRLQVPLVPSELHHEHAGDTAQSSSRSRCAQVQTSAASS
jgi:hypothetical protein